MNQTLRHIQVWRVPTYELAHVVGVDPCAAGDAHDAGLALPGLDVGGVQLLVGHAVHHRHELLYPRSALLLLALCRACLAHRSFFIQLNLFRAALCCQVLMSAELSSLLVKLPIIVMNFFACAALSFSLPWEHTHVSSVLHAHNHALYNCHDSLPIACIADLPAESHSDGRGLVHKPF